jgi:hypothetical protein
MKNEINKNQTERNPDMENVAQLQITQLIKATRPAIGRTKSNGAILPKIFAFLCSVFTRHDLDYATFERLESKRTPQAMRKNGLY